MVKNIPGLIAGGYNIDKIFEVNAEISKENISAALDDATQVIDKETKAFPCLAFLLHRIPINRPLGLHLGS